MISRFKQSDYLIAVIGLIVGVAIVVGAAIGLLMADWDGAPLIMGQGFFLIGAMIAAIVAERRLKRPWQ